MTTTATNTTIGQYTGTSSSTRPGRRATASAVGVASVISVPACIGVALAATAAGTPADFSPIASPYLFIIVDVVLGILAGAIGWKLVGRRSADPARTLKRLVPVVLLASFVPDLLIGVANVFPHTTVSGVLTLMTMHVVVAVVAVGSYLRFLSPWRH